MHLWVTRALGFLTGAVGWLVGLSFSLSSCSSSSSSSASPLSTAIHRRYTVYNHRLSPNRHHLASKNDITDSLFCPFLFFAPRFYGPSISRVVEAPRGAWRTGAVQTKRERCGTRNENASVLKFMWTDAFYLTQYIPSPLCLAPFLIPASPLFAFLSSSRSSLLPSCLQHSAIHLPQYTSS